MITGYTCVLFDMDGVVLDTESQYSSFWQAMGEKYKANVPDMYRAATGLSDVVIPDRFFSHLTDIEIASVYDDINSFERQMSFPEMTGVVAFIRSLKKK